MLKIHNILKWAGGFLKKYRSSELQVEDNGWKKTKENDGKKQCYRKKTQRWDFILTVEHHMFCTKGRRSHDILLIRHWCWKNIWIYRRGSRRAIWEVSCGYGESEWEIIGQILVHMMRSKGWWYSRISSASDQRKGLCVTFSGKTGWWRNIHGWHSGNWNRLLEGLKGTWM